MHEPAQRRENRGAARSGRLVRLLTEALFPFVTFGVPQQPERPFWRDAAAWPSDPPPAPWRGR